MEGKKQNMSFKKEQLTQLMHLELEDDQVDQQDGVFGVVKILPSFVLGENEVGWLKKEVEETVQIYFNYWLASLSLSDQTEDEFSERTPNGFARYVKNSEMLKRITVPLEDAESLTISSTIDGAVVSLDEDFAWERLIVYRYSWSASSPHQGSLRDWSTLYVQDALIKLMS